MLASARSRGPSRPASPLTYQHIERAWQVGNTAVDTTRLSAADIGSPAEAQVEWGAFGCFGPTASAPMDELLRWGRGRAGRGRRPGEERARSGSVARSFGRLFGCLFVCLFVCLFGCLVGKPDRASRRRLHGLFRSAHRVCIGGRIILRFQPGRSSGRRRRSAARGRTGARMELSSPLVGGQGRSYG